MVLITLTMAKHISTGRLGEQMAVSFFEKRGFVILHQNWRYSYWEVDIIASKEDVLHFIEVKTRRNKKFGYPEEDVTQKKLENLIEASEEYLFQNPQWKRIQFDILSINLNYKKDPEYFLIEDVYL